MMKRFALILAALALAAMPALAATSEFHMSPGYCYKLSGATTTTINGKPAISFPATGDPYALCEVTFPVTATSASGWAVNIEGRSTKSAIDSDNKACWVAQYQVTTPNYSWSDNEGGTNSSTVSTNTLSAVVLGSTSFTTSNLTAYHQAGGVCTLVGGAACPGRHGVLKIMRVTTGCTDNAGAAVDAEAFHLRYPTP
jgi:hypothetical protein